MLDLVGWLATAIFTSSYFLKHPAWMRAVQAAAALVWIGYGVMNNARPVIGANIIVAVIASYSAWKHRGHIAHSSEFGRPEEPGKREMTNPVV
jgi:hypothetical protein